MRVAMRCPSLPSCLQTCCIAGPHRYQHSQLSDMLRMLQVLPQDEGLSSEPECEIYCYSWSRPAPAPETPSRQEAGAALRLSCYDSIPYLRPPSLGQVAVTSRWCTML